MKYLNKNYKNKTVFYISLKIPFDDMDMTLLLLLLHLIFRLIVVGVHITKLRKKMIEIRYSHNNNILILINNIIYNIDGFYLPME